MATPLLRQKLSLCHVLVAYLACLVAFHLWKPWDSELQTATLHVNYSLQQFAYVPEFDIHCSLYRHLATGAQVLSVRSSDSNKVFGVAFRTPPSDSTGVAHILEHSVLCGSDKYRTKEPFVDLLRGSLQTFLNAMTWPDRTVYPVASQNNKDFYNLADVYLDAVFHPRAAHDENVMRQEGWHFELDDVNDPLEFKGVVYNEMKGVYSDAESLLGRRAQQLLFPDVKAYNVDSGGDPSEIPELTYAKFLQFYNSFYTPANARVWMYGDNDELERLAFLDSRLNHAWQARQPATEVSKAPCTTPESAVAVGAQSAIPFQSLKHIAQWHRFPYAATSDQMQEHYVAINWVVTEARPLSEEESLLVSLLNHVLVGNSASVLVKVLTESRLGTRVIDDGFDFTLQQGIFSVGMTGIAPGNQQAVVDLILGTLQKLVDAANDAHAPAAPDTFVSDLAEATAQALGGGNVETPREDIEEAASLESSVVESALSEESIAAALNSLEFRLREMNSGRPRGLTLMLGVMNYWNYDWNPISALSFQESVDRLRKDPARTRRLLRAKLLEYLLNNQHWVTVEMYPDDEAQDRVRAEEVARLASLKKRFSTSVTNSGDLSLEKIVKNTAELKALQRQEDSAEAKATIPKLSLEDIDIVAPNRYATSIVQDSSSCASAASAVSDSGSSATNPILPCPTILSTVIPEASSIVYLQVAFDVRMLSVAELQLLPLFCDLMLDSGTDTGFDRVEVMRLRDGSTGGITMSPIISSASSQTGFVVPSTEEADVWLVLKSKALESQVPSLMSLCELLLLHARLDDRARAIEYLRDRKAGLESSIPSRGHAFANTRMRSHYSLRGALDELLHGIESYHYAVDLLSHLDTVAASADGATSEAVGEDETRSEHQPGVNEQVPLLRRELEEEDSRPPTSDPNPSNDRSAVAWASILRTLRGIRRKILLQRASARWVAGIGSTQDALDKYASSIPGFLQRLSARANELFGDSANANAGGAGVAQHLGKPANPVWHKWFMQFKSTTLAREAFLVPTQVNYVGLALPLVSPGQTIQGPMLVVNKLLQMGFLWDNVRVSGGAYGGFSVLDKNSGVFTLLSYRDPNFCETIITYAKLPAFLETANFSDSDIETAIIGTIGDLDQPQSADNVAFSSLSRFFSGIDDSTLDTLRHQVLTTTLDDIRAFGRSLNNVLYPGVGFTAFGDSVASASIVSSAIDTLNEQSTMISCVATDDEARPVDFSALSIF